MKLFSKASEYAIRIVMHVVEIDAMDGFSPKDACSGTGIPEPFSRKVLGELVKADILRGNRGPGGGYQLALDPAKVSLLDVVLAVDGPGAFSTCPLGVACETLLCSEDFMDCETCNRTDPNCGLDHLCPLHGMWKEIRMLVVRQLGTTTIKDIQDRLATSGVQPDAPAPDTNTIVETLNSPQLGAPGSGDGMGCLP